MKRVATNTSLGLIACLALAGCAPDEAPEAERSAAEELMSKGENPADLQAATSRLESLATSYDGVPNLTEEERRQLDEATKAYFAEMDRLGDELLTRETLRTKDRGEAILQQMDAAGHRLEERHRAILGPERADAWAKSLMPQLKHVGRELERLVSRPSPK
jgi:hypothetical protein